MLQGMERFAGIFICTTNLFEDLDEAALRRFTFKIRFHPLTREQREQMFVAEALANDKAALTAEQRQRLADLDQLVAGRLCRRAAAGRHPGAGLRPGRIPVATGERTPCETRGSPAPRHRFFVTDVHIHSNPTLTVG